MADQIEIVMPETIINEQSTLTATAYFRDRATKASSTPTTIHYRLECLSTKREITDWTVVTTPAASNTIALSLTQNKILDDGNTWETKQLIVKIDDTLSTQVIASKTYKVRNLQGYT